jgi:Ca2+-binding EF-hand superfamily protein
MLTLYDQDGSGSISKEEFMDLTSSYRKLEKERVRQKAGFQDEEVEDFQVGFLQYDRDRSGELSIPELMGLLKEMNMFPRDKEQQAKLSVMMKEADRDESGQLTFEELLHLMRRFQDEVEVEQYSQQRKAQEKTGFSDTEVIEFWDVFARFRKEDDDSNGEEFTIFALRAVIRSLGVTLNSKQMLELKGVFRDYAKPSSVQDSTTHLKLQLPFPEFLTMMGHLIQSDFADLGTISKRTAEIQASEREKMDQLMRRVQDQKEVADKRRETARATWKASKDRQNAAVENTVVENEEENFLAWYHAKKIQLEKRKKSLIEYRETQVRIKRLFGGGNASPLSPNSQQKSPMSPAATEPLSPTSPYAQKSVWGDDDSPRELQESSAMRESQASPVSPRNARLSMLSPAANPRAAFGVTANRMNASERASQAFKDLIAELKGNG